MSLQNKALFISEEEIDEIGRDNIRAFLLKYLIHFSMVCASPVAVYHVIKALSKGEEDEHFGARIFGTGSLNTNTLNHRL